MVRYINGPASNIGGWIIIDTLEGKPLDERQAISRLNSQDEACVDFRNQLSTCDTEIRKLKKEKRTGTEAAYKRVQELIVEFRDEQVKSSLIEQDGDRAVEIVHEWTERNRISFDWCVLAIGLVIGSLVTVLISIGVVSEWVL